MFATCQGILQGDELTMIYYKKTLGLLLVVLTLAVFAACSSDGDDDGVSTQAPAAVPTSVTAVPTKAPVATQPPAQPKVTRVVMGVTPPMEETNVPRHTGATSFWHIRPEYEYLIELDPVTGELSPALATEWDLEADGQSLRFKLRQGVQFHRDAGSFTAKDVVFSWKDLTQEDSLMDTAKRYFQRIDEIELINDYEVVFRFNTPDADFLSNLSDSQSGFEITSKANSEANGEPDDLDENPPPGTEAAPGSVPNPQESRGDCLAVRAHSPSVPSTARARGCS